ncbi:hypothetical protein F4820DRAFT_447811 [Hypoxylon rubiginosum]|uniref:Uncharacterized protein n=1 Tax=Hypoxylon rubiginosum TaxID=110542 RepID=A0ACB9Z360_9PEZI|nr:hypothetical protein F4820DRAFT_447811 [Hypoxylon rubiginosum]
MSRLGGPIKRRRPAWGYRGNFGGHVYQAPYEKLPDYLDSAVNETAGAAPPTPTNVNIALHMSQSVELLRMFESAVWICMSILVYFMTSSFTLALASRRWAALIRQRINSIADVAVLAAGSERLLNLVKDKSSKELKDDSTAKSVLGCFVDADVVGQWGIELVSQGQEMRNVSEGDTLLPEAANCNTLGVETLHG